MAFSPYQGNFPKTETVNTSVLNSPAESNDRAEDPDGIDLNAISEGSRRCAGRRSVKTDDLDDLLNSLNQSPSMDSSSNSGQSPSSVDEYETDVIDDITTSLEEINYHGDAVSNETPEAAASHQSNSSLEEHIVSSKSESESENCNSKDLDKGTPPTKTTADDAIETLSEGSPPTMTAADDAIETLSEGAPPTKTAADDAIETLSEGSPPTKTAADNVIEKLSEGSPPTKTAADDAIETLSEGSPPTKTSADDAIEKLSEGSRPTKTAADDAIETLSEGSPPTIPAANDAIETLSEGAPPTITAADDAIETLSEGSPPPKTAADDAIETLSEGPPPTITAADDAIETLSEGSPPTKTAADDAIETLSAFKADKIGSCQEIKESKMKEDTLKDDKLPSRLSVTSDDGERSNRKTADSISADSLASSNSCSNGITQEGNPVPHVGNVVVSNDHAEDRDKQLSGHSLAVDTDANFLSKTIDQTSAVSSTSEQSSGSGSSHEGDLLPSSVDSITRDESNSPQSTQSVEANEAVGDIGDCERHNTVKTHDSKEPYSQNTDIISCPVANVQEEAIAGGDKTNMEVQNDNDSSDRLKRFRNHLQCLKSKAMYSFEDNPHQDKPVVPDLSDIHTCRKDCGDDRNKVSGLKNGDGSVQTNRSVPLSDGNDDDEPQGMSNILQEINNLIARHDSDPKCYDSRAITSSIGSDSNANGSKSSTVSDYSNGVQGMKSLHSIETMNASGISGKIMNGDGSNYITGLISDNDNNLGGPSTSSSRGGNEKDDTFNDKHKNNQKERPQSEIRNVIGRLIENLSFQSFRENSFKSSRSSSVQLSPPPAYQAIRFYNMADDHETDRGLSVLPKDIEALELSTFNTGPQQGRDETDIGETNGAFEGDTNGSLGGLVQLLEDLSEQLKNVKSLSELNAADENTDKSVHEIRAELLENLRLLQNRINVNTEPEIDSIDQEDDYFQTVSIHEGAMRLAGLDREAHHNPEEPMIVSKRSNDTDNLSLEFFVPGSTKTFRLHRKTFFAFVLKYSIFMFSFLFWITSLSVVSFGGWMLATETAVVIDDFTDVFLDPYALLCMVGGIIFIVAFFGCVGALRENICLLKIFHLAMTFVFVLEMLVGIIVFLFFTLPEFRQAVKVGPEEVLKNAVVNYFDDEGMQRWIDNLQKEFRCCGTSLTDDGYLDWQENAYFNCSSPSMYRCSVPLSCCIFEKGDFIDYMCGADIIRREESYVKRYINTKGCMKSLGEWLADNTTIIAYITAGIVIPQILSVVSARYFNTMLRKLTREEDRSQEEIELADNGQRSSYAEQDEECGLVEEQKKTHKAASFSARRSWRRLSYASKALFQPRLGSRASSSRHETNADHSSENSYDSNE